MQMTLLILRSGDILYIDVTIHLHALNLSRKQTDHRNTNYVVLLGDRIKRCSPSVCLSYASVLSK